MKVDARVTAAAFMLGLFAVMSATATTFPAVSRMVPLTVSLPAMALCAYVLWDEVAHVRRTRVSPKEAQRTARPRDLREQPVQFRDEVTVILWLWVFAAAIIAAGFLVGSTVATLAFVHFRLRERMRITVAMGAAMYLTLYLVFEKLLGAVLFEGLIVGR